MTVSTFSYFQDFPAVNDYDPKHDVPKQASQGSSLPWLIGGILRRDKGMVDFSSSFSIKLENSSFFIETIIPDQCNRENEMVLIYDHFFGKPKTTSMFSGKVISKSKAKSNISMDEEYL